MEKLSGITDIPITDIKFHHEIRYIVGSRLYWSTVRVVHVQTI